MAYKPYPCNIYTHSGIDAALALRKQGLHPDDIESIVLEVPTPVVPVIGEPIERKRQPHTGYEAKFSGPYAVAAALINDDPWGPGLADFTDAAVEDSQRRALSAKVVIRGAATLPARLHVKTSAGKGYDEFVPVNRGTPASPLSRGELSAKFRRAVGSVLPAAAVDRLYHSLAKVAHLETVRDILSPTHERY